MLCEGDLVVTNVGAMPEVVEGVGFVVDLEEKNIALTLTKALSLPCDVGERARKNN